MDRNRNGDARLRVLADRYELHHVLGSGGMATVWLAHDRRLGRTVAVKVLQADLSEEHAHRIEREARAAARIADSRVVTVLDLDHAADGTPFLVLEALDGQTLADELRAGPPPRERVDRLISDLLGALAAAHAVGVLHRDVKPSNVLVAGDGYRVTDFGIASLADETATAGDLMGTLVYLAPERFDGVPATPSSDVFSAAAVIYEALTGRQPFRAGTAAESLGLLRSGTFDPLPESVPVSLAHAVTVALDPDPLHRPTDAGEFHRLVNGRSTSTATGPWSASDATARLDETTTQASHAPTGRLLSVETAKVPSAVHAPPSSPDRGSRPLESTEGGMGPHAALHARRVDSTLVDRLRQPGVMTVFFGVVVLVVVAVFVVVAITGGDDGARRGSVDDPAQQLDANIERIEELGR